MKYSECKSQMIDLEEIGGNREMSLEELMDELIYYRRKNFLKTFLSLETGETSAKSCFDAISFNSLLKDFSVSFSDHNLEGTIEYSITADKDCCWQLKTSISLDTISPFFGCFKYHTEILSTNVTKRCHSLTGTLMTISIVNRKLKVVSADEIAERMNNVQM